MTLAKSIIIPISEVFTSSNSMVFKRRIKDDKDLFWEKSLEIARAHPELSAEEVEYKAVLARIGLFC